MTRNIREEISEMAIKMQLPFPLTISVGCVVTDMNSDKNLDDYVRNADEMIYQEKVAKRVNRK